jgi:hypothetical protein
MVMDLTKAKRFTLGTIRDGMVEDCGYCISCGSISEYSVEPDARNYHCTACGQDEVHGCSEILLMDLIEPEDE